MNYVTHRAHRMQKYKFNITCPGALSVESVPDPPKHDKYCDDVSRPDRIGMHCMTRRSHCIQKNFGVTCPDALYVETVPIPPENNK
jgi:hypothetical protein